MNYINERSFVENEIFRLLHAANNDIANCVLSKDRDDKFVKVHMQLSVENVKEVLSANTDKVQAAKKHFEGMGE